MKESWLFHKFLFAVSRREYFTFLVCLALSLALIFSNNNAQAERLRAILLDAWGSVLQKFSWYRSMQAMQEELSDLRYRTTRLLLENSYLREAALENARLRAMLNFKQRSDFELKGARVIARNQDRFVQSITLNVGTADGIQKDMPVISPAGLVGKIISTGKTFSIAQLVIDHNFRVACKIQRSRVDGILAYENGEVCKLTQVPKNADVRVGDVVVTSELSRLFPHGIMVGVVKDIRKDISSLFLDIEIVPAVDFSRIEEVFVITSFEPFTPN